MLAWGSNNNGQLGDGSLQGRAQPLSVSGPGGSGQLNLLQSAPISVNQLPSGQISLNVNSGKAPLTLQATAVNANDPDGTIKAYSWKASDGQQASGPSANFVFTQAGVYTIDLLIEDDAAGRGSAKAQVVVSPAAVGALSVSPKAGVGPVFSLALANDGRVLSWGAAWHLGLYDTQAQAVLPRALALPIANGIVNAVDFVIGGGHAAVLLADGTVSSWGQNSLGQVGSGSQESWVFQPQVLANLPPVQALAAGGSHSLALTRDGRVFAWGSNFYGQLGTGDANNRFSPTELAGLSNVTAIAAGFIFSMALKADGTVWAWGDNSLWQLGDGTQISRNRPAQIPGISGITKIFFAGNAGFLFKSDGTVWVTGNHPAVVISGDPGPISGSRHASAYDGIVQIAGDWQHVVALKADGTVWTGGLRSSLALGYAASGDIAGLRQLPGITDAIAVSAGDYTSMILRRDGTVLSWGANSYGQLGDGTLA